MANPIRRLVQLILDRSAAKKTEDDAKRSIGRIEAAFRKLRTTAGRVSDKFRSSWKKSFRLADDGVKELITRFKGLATIAAAGFAARALARFTGEMFSLGTAAEETGSKFETVFGREAAANLDAFITDWGKLAGLTKTEGREMAATAGAIAQGMGLAQGASALFSADILRLAGDLTSFNDIPIEETFNAIRSGIVGETEPLKNLGIVFRAVDVQQRALLNTGKERAKELTQAELATARLTIIMEKAGVAVGDLERTQGSTANTTRRMSTQFRQLKEDLAVGLLPVFSMFINAWSDAVGEMTFAQKAIAAVSDFIVKFVGGVQILAVEFNAHIRTIPARFRIAMADQIDQLVGWIAVVERLVNRIGSFIGAEAVDWTSGMRESAARLRSEGEMDIVAFRALVEEETEKILRAAHVIKDAPGPGAPRRAKAAEEVVIDDSAAKALAKKLATDAASLIQSLRTPQEVYDEEILRLAAHLEARRITQETFARGVMEAQQTLHASLKTLTKDDADAILAIQQKLAEDLEHNRALTTLISEHDAAEKEISLLTSAIQSLVAEGLNPEDEALTRLAARLRMVRGENAALQKEQETMQVVASTTAEVLNAAFGAGVGQMASGKAKQNAILAAEQLVLGFVATLNPFTAPLAAGHYAAAGEFAGISAAWGALAGATGGGGGGGGGIGGGGGGGARDIGGAASQRAEPLGPELNVYFTGEGFDAVNPVVQRVVYTAMAQARSSVGENARVRVFRGGIPNQGGS